MHGAMHELRVVRVTGVGYIRKFSEFELAALLTAAPQGKFPFYTFSGFAAG
jgi:hypothetical protein